MTQSYRSFKAYLRFLIALLIPLSASAIPEFAFYGSTDAGYVRIHSGDANPNQEEQTIGPYNRLASENQRRKRFQIKNNGDAKLLVFYPEISDMIENGFFIRDWPTNSSTPVELNPGSSFIFQIGLSPKIQTAISVLTIGHNGHGNGSDDFVIIIKGEANSGDAEFLYSPPGGGNEVAISNGDGTPTPIEGTNFGAIDIGRPGGTDPYRYDESVTHRFVLRNRSTEGDTLLTDIPRIVDDGGNTSPHFDITNYSTSNWSNPLSSTGLDIFEITYNPVSAGIHIATFTVETNDVDNPTYTFTLIGRGLTSGRVHVEGRPDTGSPYREILDGDSTPISFDGTVFPGTSTGNTSTHEFKIISTGSENLQILGQPTSSNPAFTIDPITLLTITPDPTRGVGMDINFHPTERGIAFSDITIPTNDPDHPNFTFTVVGNGFAPELVVKGTGDDGNVRDIPNNPGTAPNPIYGTLIGNVDSGDPAVTREFTLRNRGNQDAVVTEVSMSGPHAGDFTLSGLNTAGANSETIEPSSEKTMTLTFNPNATGLRVATVNIEQTHNAETLTYQFQVSANVTSTATGAIKVQGRPDVESSFKDILSGAARPSPDNGTLFPDTEVGQFSTTYFQIINAGDAPLRITDFAIEGDEAGEFQVKPTPSGTLAPEGVTTFSIRYTPIRAHSSTVTAIIGSNDPKLQKFTLILSGRGIEEPSDILPPTRIQRISFDGRDATLTLHAEAGKRFAVMVSTTLANDSWTQLPGAAIIDGGSGSQILRLTEFLQPGTAPRRFIRLEEL